MTNYNLELFADYFQFYFQDDDPDVGDLSEAWTEQAFDQYIAVTERAIGVRTVRNMDVPVAVRIVASPPNLEPALCDKVNKARILIKTGRIVFAGCTDYYPDALRIDVPPGLYEVSIGYKNLRSVSEDGLDGEDSYHVYLSPV